MNAPRPRFSRASLCALLLPLILGSCAGRAAQAPLPAPGAPLATSFGRDAALRDTTPPNVAGTYSGLLTVTEGSKELTGTVVITLVQKAKKIAGDFDITIESHTVDLTLKGKVKAAKGGAKLKFTIINVNGGRNAAAKATVEGSALDGSAIVKATASKPQVDITFQTTKES